MIRLPPLPTIPPLTFSLPRVDIWAVLAEVADREIFESQCLHPWWRMIVFGP